MKMNDKSLKHQCMQENALHSVKNNEKQCTFNCT